MDGTKSLDNLAPFRTGQYLSIITYTKGGKEIATPVWFVAQPEKVYIATPKNTYKIKRLKNDNRIKIAPSSRNGTVQGSYLRGNGRIMRAEEEQAIFKLFHQKYGFLFKLWSANIKNLFRKKAHKEKRLTYVEIMPTG